MNVTRITSSIAYLESELFDCSALRTQLHAMEECYREQQPTERDMLYAMPETAPTITEHLRSGQNPLLTAGCMWPGYSYRLTPGQRKVMRDGYDVVATQTATIYDVETWKGTRFVRSFRVSCDLHVDNVLRKSAVTTCIIKDAGAFFHAAAEVDAEKETKAAEAAIIGARKKKKDVDEVLPTLDAFLKELLS